MRPMSLLERGFADPTVSLGDLLDGSRPEIKGSSRRSTRDYVDEIVRSGSPTSTAWRHAPAGTDSRDTST